MSDKRLIFPCGAYFPLKDDQQHWLDSAHRAKDGAYRISVYPGSQPHATEETWLRVQKEYLDTPGRPEPWDRAPCLYFCPTKKRRKVERGWDESGLHGHFISCMGRICAQEHIDESDEGWYDVTPIAAKCPHCEEQKTYVQACRKAAKAGEDAPDRERWRKCPLCEQYRELTDTGLCATCALVKVVEDNRGNP